MKASFATALVTAGLLLVALLACQKVPRESGSGSGRGAPPVPVTASPVVQKDMPVVLRAIGTVRPSATVSVKPRAGGLIASVEFKEGDDVEQGDVLFTIDPKPFEVALAKAKATLAQVREQAVNAEQQVQRYSSLGKTGGVANEQLEQFRSVAIASAAASDATAAAVKEAEIQLGYCTIKSPISGRTGRRMVDAGNVVTANTTELVVVNQIKPIEVVFSLAEQHLGELSRYMGEQKLTVTAQPAGEQRQTEGELTFVDNSVNQTTGTIEAKAAFANEDLALWPGRFVDVIVALTTDPEAIVVPAPAVQTGQKGQYVFVVKSDQTVEIRPVELVRTVNQEAVIRSGLAVGESVVTDGHIRLSPGARVELKPPVGGPRQTAQAVEPATKKAAAQIP